MRICDNSVCIALLREDARSDARYCSANCRVKASAQRRREVYDLMRFAAEAVDSGDIDRADALSAAALDIFRTAPRPATRRGVLVLPDDEG